MGLKEDIGDEVAKIFKSRWSQRDGEVIPDAEDIALGNDGVVLDAAVLYADLADSTKMVDTEEAFFAAEIYKAYLISACRVIKDNGGEITAFDGDRVMAVFIGNYKCTSAALTALRINYAVKKIVNPKLKAQYPEATYEVRQVVGVDKCKLLVARTGIRNYNDLVWVGRAANHAAKLSNLSADEGRSWITEDVFKKMDANYKTYEGREVWEKRYWEEMDNRVIYKSNWTWALE